MSASAERAVAVLAVGADPGDLEGCTVEKAVDLLGALAHLSDGGIDVVLAALDLPDASGSDIVRSLRERAPAVPVIAVAAAHQSADDALGAGARDVLPADAGPDLLARSLRYAAELERLETDLERHQLVDEPTGLIAAQGFRLLAAHHLRLADRSKDPVVLVFIRLDDLGEARGGAAITEAATLLRAAVRASDVVARIGPGVFSVLLAGAGSGTESLVLARVVEAVAEHNARNGRTRGPALSVGAAVYDPEHPVGLEAMIVQADRQMREPWSET